SCRMNDSRSQEHEPGSAVHLPLDRLESVHMAFDWTVAPRLRHSRDHGRLVTPYAFRKPTYFRVRTCLASNKPVAQRPARLLADEGGEFVRQVQRGCEFGTARPDRLKTRLFGRLASFRAPNPLERQLLRRWWRQQTLRCVDMFALPVTSPQPLGHVPPNASVG